MPSITNFQPATGIGRFDLDITQNVLTVTIKLFLATGLSSTDQNTFMARFENLVKQHWENRYGFQRNTQRLFPTFKITYVANMESAHFVLNLLAGEGGNELVSRDVYYKLKNNAGFNPTSVNLFSGSINPAASSGMIVEDLRTSFPYYIDMPANSMSDHAENQLHSLIRQLKRADPNANVEVTAYGSAKSVKQNAVLAKIRLWGLANPIARTSNRHFSASRNPKTGASDYVKISMSQGLGMIDKSTDPLFNYPAAAVHEFGHMLGLQDEYACLSRTAADKMATLGFIDKAEQQFFEDFHPRTTAPPSQVVANGQEAFVAYCRDAGVLPPHFGQHTISIMSSGSKFQPCHFVTLWAAVVAATGNPPSDWKIVKH